MEGVNPWKKGTHEFHENWATKKSNDSTVYIWIENLYFYETKINGTFFNNFNYLVINLKHVSIYRIVITHDSHLILICLFLFLW